MHEGQMQIELEKGRGRGADRNSFLESCIVVFVIFVPVFVPFVLKIYRTETERETIGVTDE